jgi:hypothetical protein
MIIEYSKRQPKGAITLGDDNKWLELPADLPESLEQYGRWIKQLQSEDWIKSVTLDLSAAQGVVTCELPLKLNQRLEEEPQGVSIVFPGGRLRLKVDTGPDKKSSEIWFMQHPIIPEPPGENKLVKQTQEKSVQGADGSQLDMSYQKPAERDMTKIQVMRITEAKKPVNERVPVLTLEGDEVEEINKFMDLYDQLSAAARGTHFGTLMYKKGETSLQSAFLVPMGLAMQMLKVLKDLDLTDELHHERKRLTVRNNQAWSKQYLAAKGMKRR